MGRASPNAVLKATRAIARRIAALDTRRAVAPLLAVAVLVFGSPATAVAADPPRIKVEAGAGQQQPCDRNCLNAFVDRYLAAYVARDPNQGPFARNTRYTENGVELVLGDASWGTVSKLGKFRLYIPDVQSGEVAYIGTVFENDVRPVILALRLKVEGARITEVEHVISRSQNAAKSLDEMAKPHESFTRPLAAGDRPSRDDLIAIANTYFTGLQDNDGMRHVPFHEDCDRIENGTRTTNNPGAFPGRRTVDIAAMGCTAQLNSGFFRVDTDIRERRFRVVDAEHGLVFAFAFFDHAGTVLKYRLTTGETMESSQLQPHTWQIAEVFKVEGGRIRQIQAVLHEVPYGMGSGWNDCSGPWPTPCVPPGPPQRKLRPGYSPAHH